MEMSIIVLFLAGACGALAKDVIQDGQIKLPTKTNGNLVLGFIGGMMTGGAAGAIIDGNPMTAFLAGYAGTSALENLLLKPVQTSNSQKKVIENLIRGIAKTESVDPNLAVRVAKCESNLSPTAKNTNKDGSIDRGLFQWNNHWHPEITDEIAYDIVLSTRAFCKAFKEGHLDWWNATKDCWSK